MAGTQFIIPAKPPAIRVKATVAAVDLTTSSKLITLASNYSLPGGSRVNFKYSYVEK
jgi:hypothetical protein